MWRPFDHFLTIEEAAEELGITSEAVKDLCEKGLLNSWLEDDARYISSLHIERYLYDGPNKLMTFDEAIAFVLADDDPSSGKGHYARRPCWPKAYHIAYDHLRISRASAGQIEYICVSDSIEGNANFWDFSPTDEDRAARDFFHHETY